MIMSVNAVLVKDALDIRSLLIGPDRTGLEVHNIIISHTRKGLQLFISRHLTAWDSGLPLVL